MRWKPLTAILLVGCGSEPPPLDVETTEPASGATGVDPEGVVRVTFSREIDPASVDEESFRITRFGAPVAGRVDYDEATRTATFTPDRRLTLLSQYEAVVTEAVLDPDGESIPPNDWTFQIADGTWSEAHLMGTGARTEAPGPQLAVDAAGNAIAVWKQSDGTRSSIWARRYVVEVEWEPAVLIETDDAGSAANPHVVSDGAGNAIAIWEQSDGTRTSVWVNRHDAAAGWGVAELVEHDDGEDAVEPQIAIDAAGNALAVWRQGTAVWARWHRIGEGWKDPAMIEADPDANSFNPQVAVNPTGSAIVAWEQIPAIGGFSGIAATTYDPVDGWAPATSLDAAAVTSIWPHAAIDPAGNAVVVWQKYSGPASDIWARRYDAAAGWAPATTIDVGDEDFAWEPRVALDAAGNATAVWQEGLRIRSARYDAATETWGGEELISDEGNGQRPRLGMDGLGNLVAVWADRSFMICNRYVDGVGWLGVGDIQVPVAGGAETPDVAVDPGGNAIAIWNHMSETGDEITILASTFR